MQKQVQGSAEIGIVIERFGEYFGALQVFSRIFWGLFCGTETYKTSVKYSKQTQRPNTKGRQKRNHLQNNMQGL